MKRVLIVYHYFALYRLPIISKLMQREGYEFTLISSAQSRAGIRTIDSALADLPVSEGGIRWEFLDNVWLGGNRSPLLWQRGLIQRLKQDDYDAVIFLGVIYFLSTWLAIRQAKKRGKRVVIWTHGFLGKDSKWIAALRHRLYRMADACLLYGNRARDIMLSSNYYKPEDLDVVYNSLDYEVHCKGRVYSKTDAQRQQKVKFFGDDTLPVVTYIGRLTRDKSLHLLIEALGISVDNGKPFRVILIGDGVLEGELRNQVAKLKLVDFVHFYGYCDSEKADQVLAAGDLCVVPGEVGLTGMHAMSLGVPVVSHGDLNVQKPEFEAIVEGKTGAIFKRGDANDLAKTLGLLFSDRNQLECMRKNCFSMIDTFFNPDYQSEVICNAVNGVPNKNSDFVPSVLFNQ
jgi:glycosyltransferase involved in cell wall biosynthesis